ncbi:MAG: hypothetical protein EBT33_23175, partial [Betaproteobacteria bacterium]|nr:hypothetical protein [Betaproteobacteria bacterium]
STASIPLSTPVQATGTPATLSIPAARITTPGALQSLPFGSSALTGAGNVLLSFTATGDAQFEWSSSGSLKASASAGSTLAASTTAASSVSLYGDVAALNAYLHAGNLKLRSSGAGSVTVTVTAGDFVSASTIPVTLQGNTAQARTGPALAIPARFNVPASTGLITLDADGVLYAPSSGTGLASDVLTLTISIPDSVTLSGSQGLGTVTSAGAASSLSRTLTLSGTAAQLNASLLGTSGADRIRYVGPVSAPLVFSVTDGTSLDGVPISSTVTSLVNTVSTIITANPDVSETTAAFASLPTKVWVTPYRDSDLRFVGASLTGALANGTDELRLRFVPGAAAGTLTATASGYVTVHTVNTHTEIRGKASDLATYLATPGVLRYNGGGTTYTLELRDAQNQLD